MTTTAPAALTYGDTFTLPCTPGTVWKVRDVRKLDEHGTHRESRAEAHPFTVNGEPSDYDTPVQIGRATRKHPEILFDNDGTPRYATTGSYSEPLTDAQKAALIRDAGELSFDFPPLTVAEVRERFVSAVVSNAESALYGMNRAPGRQYGGSRNEVVYAATSDPETVAAAIDAATEAFRARMVKELAR